MSWKSYINGFKSWLKVERSLSGNSVEAYLHDMSLFEHYLESEQLRLPPADIRLEHLQGFIVRINEQGLSARSQARIISGLKSFFKYCLLENLTQDDPPNSWKPRNSGESCRIRSQSMTLTA